MHEFLEWPLLTRRQFLRRLGFAAGGVVASALSSDLSALAAPRRSLDIIIVGAGLAGLCAAYELELRGHRCVLLEAEPVHIGGRVRTLRFEGGYGEAGAMRIPAKHELPRRYAKEFGLELRRFVQSNPNAYYYVRDARQRIRDVQRLTPLYALRGSERHKTPDRLWAETVGRVLKKLTANEKRDLFGVTPKTRPILDVDQKSIQQLLKEQHLSDEAIEYLMVTSGAESLALSAATEFLREDVAQIWQDFHEIVGGMDRLPAAFAERLNARPRLGCEVVRLEQDSERKTVVAIYRQGTSYERVAGDFLICTLPFPALQRLEISPPFSPAKQRAIRELHYESSTKVLAVSRQRFWESRDQIFGGKTITDLPSGLTYYPSDNAATQSAQVSQGPGVLLASYTWGQLARRLASLPHEQRSRLILSHLGRVHRELAEKDIIASTASWSWDNHPWSGGAFAWFMPGQHTALYRHILSPEGHIFFAGEHASLDHTWMQGALESGLRAVHGVLTEVHRF